MWRKPCLRRVAAAVAALIFLAIPTGVRASQGLVRETEPNGTPATATLLVGSTVVVEGYIHPAGDVDYYSFSANGGNRVYAATMSWFGGGSVADPVLDLLAADGATVVESDDFDAWILDASIAGATLPGSGTNTYYLRVRNSSALGETRPYHLHLRIVSGATVNEHEPNDTAANAALVVGGAWRRGSRSSSTDQDWYRIDLGAGDTIFAGLDLDPERDGVSWNGRIRFGFFGDGATETANADNGETTPFPSEALVQSVARAGAYYVIVDSADASTGTYHLSIAVHPVTPETPTCTTYTSSDVPKALSSGSVVLSSLAVPGHPRIADADVSVAFQNATVKAFLRSPAGNRNQIFGYFGASGSGSELTVDDEAGFLDDGTVPRKGLMLQPSGSRLAWLDGEDAGGTWTLELECNFAVGGMLNAWSLTLCEPAPAPLCSGVPVALLSADFEADDEGFTHSGAGDEWARGFPTGSSAPVVGCNGGTNCFKTDLLGGYNASSAQELISPPISLVGLTAPLVVEWAQAYQMGDATKDHLVIEAREIGGTGSARLFEWLGFDMRAFQGSTAIPGSAGWGLARASVDALAGKTVDVRFHLDSGATNFNFSGLAVDDVRVTGCCTLESCRGGNSCVDPACDPVLGCVRTLASGRSCNDGNACTSADTCAAGVCVGTPVVNCDDGNACTDDACNPATGLCSHVSHVCDDGNACTDNACVPATGCVFTPDDTNTCTDGSLCTSGDACHSGSCSGTPIACNDANVCTSDSCNPAAGCVHASACDDGNSCTTDACISPAAGCSHTTLADGNTCNDGSYCTFPDRCSAGRCVGSIDPSCWSPDPCTIASCDTSPGGICHREARNCSDGNPCTTDLCSSLILGLCGHTPAPAPADPTGLRLEANKAGITWSATAGASTYDVARGVVNELPVGAGPAEICLAPRTSATATIDPFPPAAGQALWYLVRARNACGQSLNGAYGQGIYGGQFQPRVTQVCP